MKLLTIEDLQESKFLPKMTAASIHFIGHPRIPTMALTEDPYCGLVWVGSLLLRKYL